MKDKQKVDTKNVGKKYKNEKERRKGKSMKLPKDDMAFLDQNTKFNRGTINDWYKGFMVDCPDGRMDKNKMREMFNSILPKDDPNDSQPSSAGDQFLDQLFRIFDRDGDGTIDFKEFMIATDMSSSGDPEEKLRWAFRMYDKDGSEEIDLEEMVEIFCLMYAIQGYPEEEATARAIKIFETLDRNNDGGLTEDEFVKGCLADEEMMEMLNTSPA